jgi:hypothetical protein
MVLPTRDFLSLSLFSGRSALKGTTRGGVTSCRRPLDRRRRLGPPAALIPSELKTCAKSHSLT